MNSVNLAALPLAHDSSALCLLVLFRHGECQRQRWWHVAKQGFQVIGEHHAFDVLAGFLARRKQQAALFAGQVLETGDLLDLFLGHDQTQPPFHHVEHLAAGVGEVFQVLRGDPKPGAEFAPHLGDLDHITGQQGIGGEDVAFGGHNQGGSGIVLVTLHQIVDVAHHGDIGHGELILVTFPRQHTHLEYGDIRLRPGFAAAVEEMTSQP